MTAVEHVEASALRDAIGRGEQFAGAWATATHWRVLVGGRVITCAVPQHRVDTIVDIVAAAAWDEREAHDLYGLRFDGHEPLRPLAAHTDDLAAWTTDVTGDGVHQVAVGPIHAGIIESGHFRFHVVGERILALDPRLFYQHRGLEPAAEGRSVEAARAHSQRACAACAVANTIAYAQAVEDATGRSADRDLRVARTLLLELERLYNHLHDISAICAGVGFAPGTTAFAALKDRAQRLNTLVAGHRFLFDTIAVGRSALVIDGATAYAARAALRELRADAAAAWRELEFAAPVQARLDGIGVLDHDTALTYGAVGPAARAAGVHADVRADSPELWFPDFVAAAPPRPTGDVAARLQMRAVELEATGDILDDLLATPITGGASTPARAPSEIGVGRVESPRGATMCAVELDATRSRVARLHLRTGSYANWPALAHATTDNLLPDFPLINKSFELCYACVDR